MPATIGTIIAIIVSIIGAIGSRTKAKRGATWRPVRPIAKCRK
jgi:hypothetical protein